MPWIQSDTTLTRKPKFKKLIRDLNINTIEGVGHLTFFWHNIMELAEDGDITKWKEEDISEYFDWKKDPKILYKVLLENNWIEKNNKFTLIHDWLDYSGNYLKLKYRTSNPSKLKEMYKKHKTALNLSLDSKKTAKIDKIILDKIRLHYIQLKHWKEENLVSKDYARIHSAIKDLILKTRGDVVKAMQAIDWTSKRGYSDWTMETVVKKYADFDKVEVIQGAGGRDL